MGRIAKQLRREFQTALGQKIVSLAANQEPSNATGPDRAAEFDTFDTLIHQGRDPVQAPSVSIRCARERAASM